MKLFRIAITTLALALLTALPIQVYAQKPLPGTGVSATDSRPVPDNDASSAAEPTLTYPDYVLLPGVPYARYLSLGGNLYLCHYVQDPSIGMALGCHRIDWTIDWWNDVP